MVVYSTEEDEEGDGVCLGSWCRRVCGNRKGAGIPDEICVVLAAVHESTDSLIMAFSGRTHHEHLDGLLQTAA